VTPANLAAYDRFGLTIDSQAGITKTRRSLADVFADVIAISFCRSFGRIWWLWGLARGFSGGDQFSNFQEVVAGGGRLLFRQIRCLRRGSARPSPGGPSRWNSPFGQGGLISALTSQVMVDQGSPHRGVDALKAHDEQLRRSAERTLEQPGTCARRLIARCGGKSQRRQAG